MKRWTLAVALAGCAPSLEGDVSIEAVVLPLDRVDGRVASRVAAAREAVQAAPGDEAAWGELGLVLEANDLEGLALGCYAELAHIAPTAERWCYRAGIVCDELGRTREALAWFERAHVLDDSRATTAGRIGVAHLELGNLGAARLAFEEAVRLDPRITVAWIGLGRVSLQEDDPRAAVQALARAREASPGDRYVRGLLGAAYRQLGRWQEAGVELRAAAGAWAGIEDPRDAELDPYRVDAYYARLLAAKRILERGAFEEALTELRPLADERPGDVGLLTLLAFAASRSGHPEEARKAYARCVDLEPENRWTLVQYAVLLGTMGRADEALATVRRAIDADPAFGGAYEVLGGLLLEQGREGEALAAYRAGLEYDARNPAAQLALGRLQRKLGHWQEALETYERAVRRRPAPPEAHAGLARCRLHEGDAQGAADALRPVAASSDPEVVELRTAIEARLAGSRR